MGRGDSLQRLVAPEDRARQFMPFAALKGYYDLVRERERVCVPRREMPEEEAARLSEQVLGLSKGDMIAVTYYDADAYVTLQGMVAEIDITSRTLRVVKTRIAFDDMLEVTCV